MWQKIINTTLLAGSLDIIAAFIQAYIKNKVPPDIVLKYIASGMFGNKSFEGGFEMILVGLIVHFIITFACVSIFFLIYPKLKILHHKIIINSLIIAILAWVVTNLVIIPSSKIGPKEFEFKSVLIAVGTLFLFVGMPIAYSAKRFFIRQAIKG